MASEKTSIRRREEKNNTKEETIEWKTTQSNMSVVCSSKLTFFFSIIRLLYGRIKIDRGGYVYICCSLWSINKLAGMDEKGIGKMVTTNYFPTKPHKMYAHRLTKSEISSLTWLIFQEHKHKNTESIAYAPLHSLALLLYIVLFYSC